MNYTYTTSNLTNNKELKNIIHGTQKTMDNIRKKHEQEKYGIKDDKKKKSKSHLVCRGCKNTFKKDDLIAANLKSKQIQYYCKECNDKRIYRKEHGNYSLIKTCENEIKCTGCGERYIKKNMVKISDGYYRCQKCNEKRIYNVEHGNFTLKNTEENLAKCTGCGKREKKKNMERLYEHSGYYKCQDCFKKHKFHKKVLEKIDCSIDN